MMIMMMMIKMMIMMMMVIMGLKVWIMDRLRTDIEKKLHVCSARGDVNGGVSHHRQRVNHPKWPSLTLIPRTLSLGIEFAPRPAAPIIVAIDLGGSE